MMEAYLFRKKRYFVSRFLLKVLSSRLNRRGNQPSQQPTVVATNRRTHVSPDFDKSSANPTFSVKDKLKEQ